MWLRYSRGDPVSSLVLSSCSTSGSLLSISSSLSGSAGVTSSLSTSPVRKGMRLSSLTVGHVDKKLLFLPHTFRKVIRLGQEEVNNIWMLLDKLFTLKLAVEKKQRIDGRMSNWIQIFMSSHVFASTDVPLQRGWQQARSLSE